MGLRLGTRGRARPGDGITERVIDTGKPVVVPRVSQEPALAGTTGGGGRSARELTYVAVPVAVVAGLLAVAFGALQLILLRRRGSPDGSIESES